LTWRAWIHPHGRDWMDWALPGIYLVTAILWGIVVPMKFQRRLRRQNQKKTLRGE
jgi:hypothetical protein